MRVHINISGVNNAVIRTWAIKSGHYVAEFGPIPWEVRRAFDAAHVAAVQEASQRFLTEAGAWP